MNNKEINNVFLNPDFLVKLMDLFQEYGLVNEVAVRNALIRKDWIEARRKGISNNDFIISCAEKYFLSEKSIESVLYGQSREKYTKLETKNLIEEKENGKNSDTENCDNG